jgi:RNA polymerase sigma-70 factor (ECF subfamily)
MVPGLAVAKGPGNTFELHWEAPPNCPTQGDVRAEVQRLLGDVETPATGKVDAAAHVGITPGGFELRLTLQQNHEVRERTLQAPTCQELGRAAALVLALAVNPALQQEPPASPAEPPPCPPTEAAPALLEGRDSSPTAPAELEVAAIYDAHFDFVWCALRRLGVQAHQLEDAVQDVFVVVQRRLSDFEQRSSVKTWLYGIALRVAKDHRRSQVKRGAEVSEADVALQGSAPDPREAAQQAEAAAVVQALLDTLDEDRRTIFVMTELEGVTASEVAETLGVGLNTVYSRLRLARRDLEQALVRYRARTERGTP